MTKNVVFVVGDRFTDGTPHAGMISLSGLLADLETGRLREPLPVLVPGQGVEQSERDRIRTELRRCCLPESALFDRPTPRPARRPDTHKRSRDNVVIAGLRRVDDTRFAAELRLSDRQEMVLDHATGCHVAGMVIIEAVRQMCLAVAERYLATPDLPPHRFLINAVETTFSHFLFPLPTAIDCRLEECVWKGPARLRFRCRCDFVQAGVIVASGSMDMVVMEEALAIRLEEKQSVEVYRTVAGEVLGDAFEDEHDVAPAVRWMAG